MTLPGVRQRTVCAEKIGDLYYLIRLDVSVSEANGETARV